MGRGGHASDGARDRRRVAPPRDVPPLLRAERPLPAGLRPGDRGSSWRRRRTATRSPRCSRFQSQIVENEIPANLAFLERLGGDAGDRRGPRGDAADHVRLHPPPARDLRCRATAQTGSPPCCRVSGATASSRGRSRRTRPPIRSTRTGSRCSATTSTTGWSRRRPRCSTGSSIPTTRTQDGGALADLRTLDAVRSRVLGHGLREPPAGRSPRRRRNPLDAAVRIHEDLTLRVDEIDDLDARAGRGAGADPRRRRVRDRPAHPRRHDQARSLPDDARARGGRRGGGGGRRSVARGGDARGDLQQDLLRSLRAVPEGPHEHLRQRARSARFQPRRRGRGVRRGPRAERCADPRRRRPRDRRGPHVRRHDGDARDQAVGPAAGRHGGRRRDRRRRDPGGPGGGPRRRTRDRDRRLRGEAAPRAPSTERPTACWSTPREGYDDGRRSDPRADGRPRHRRVLRAGGDHRRR